MAKEEDFSDNEENIVKIKSNKKKSGGFQSMGLSYSVLKGVLKKGYKVPTPIQRKTIPLIIEEKDVVAMARTGSGKTAAFLLPMFEKLKTHSAKTGARALILSPTRELALQTFKFTKELGKFTTLKAAVILGGDNMEDQFLEIHKNPDIIIATPGRLLHVIVEMDLKLSNIEYLVFDEADRLFELGFFEQLQEIINRLPEHRQTLLFSATLPAILVDFAKAGLRDPVLIRMDVESKLSENLKTSYIFSRTEDKLAILLYLLKFVVQKGQLTVIFVATRHHAEYIKIILEKANILCTYVYSSLDQTARKINIAQFRSRKISILIVTDIAARGIDIPHLDNVINYNFPAKPKLFVHRVGRVARAGQSGSAYSLIAPDEAAYLLDLYLFLNRPLHFSENTSDETNDLCGSAPQSIIDEEADLILEWHQSNIDLRNLKKVCENAYKQYIKSRPAPSAESVRRAKVIFKTPPKLHLLFTDKEETVTEKDRVKLLESIKSYRPNSTIFEVGSTAKSQAGEIMRSKRKYHNKIINKTRNFSSVDSCSKEDFDENISDLHEAETKEMVMDHNGRSQTLEITFTESNKVNKKRKKSYKNGDFYISYRPEYHHSEKGLEVEKNFDQQINNAVLDLTTDDVTEINRQKSKLKWDRKKKKFIRGDNNDPKNKKIKTESGVWIPASYKSDRYKQWKDKFKITQPLKSTEEEVEESEFGKERPGMKAVLKKKYQNKKHYRPELKTREEILKNRKRKAKLIFRQKHRHNEKLRKKGLKK
ncbi:ATP-dependent RNA helicase DDX54 [Centruroides vittatus]|uniref:ATP-dependent RNA helicase DDX54 n=1 Tax=Centruroides vittatus TaxID=120091 RepID=UPI00351034CF